MTRFEIFALAAALAMDAFSVSVSAGMNENCTFKNAAKMSFLFGAFQFFMPVAGNGAALLFVNYTRRFAPFITFVVLSFLGVKMMVDSRGGSGLSPNPFKNTEVLLLAFATSVDALAAGVSIRAADCDVLSAAAVIGAAAALLSAAGLCIGKFTRRLLPFPAELAGGAALIIIAVKSLIEAVL